MTCCLHVFYLDSEGAEQVMQMLFSQRRERIAAHGDWLCARALSAIQELGGTLLTAQLEVLDSEEIGGTAAAAPAPPPESARVVPLRRRNA
jgi:hypothetical protein